MDDEQLKSLRISIRRTRTKIRKQISTTFPIPDIVNIVIDYICWNRRIVDTIRDNNILLTIWRRHFGLALTMDCGTFVSHTGTRAMDANCGIWSLLRKFDNEQYHDWGYSDFREYILKIQSKEAVIPMLCVTTHTKKRVQ